MTTTGASLTRLRYRSRARSPQAGLPLDKFWAVEAAPGLDEDAEFVLQTDQVCLIKVFRTDEETFIDAVKGQHHLGQVLEAGHHRMIQERLDAIGSCGYLSVLSSCSPMTD